MKPVNPTTEADQINLVSLVNCFFNCPGYVTRDDLKIKAKKNNWSTALVKELDKVLIDAYENHEWDCLQRGHWSFKYAQKGRAHIGIAGAPPTAEQLKKDAHT